MAEGWDVGGAQALQTWAPTAGAAVAALVAAWPEHVPAARLREVRSATAEAVGAGALPAPAEPDDPGEVPSLAVLTFAEQLAADVTSIADGQREAFAAATSPAAHEVALAAAVADAVSRARAVLDGLFGPGPWDDADPAPTAYLRWLVAELGREVALIGVLDPVTVELVRLRVARRIGSRVGMARRSLDAVRAGADAATFAAVDHYRSSSLSEVRCAALGLADAALRTPAGVRPADLEGARRHLSPAEAVAVVLVALVAGLDKAAVALGTDEPDGDGIQLFVLDESGDVCFP